MAPLKKQTKRDPLNVLVARLNRFHLLRARGLVQLQVPEGAWRSLWFMPAQR